MSILTIMVGIPLFSTVQEALTWAKANSLNGYHTHSWNGKTGYMGGVNHAETIKATTPTITRESSRGGY